MRELVNIANRTITQSIGSAVVRNKDGNTTDIITQIQHDHAVGWKNTSVFAPHLRSKDNLAATCSNIWHFVKTNIRYKLDPVGIQYIKTPSRTWKDRFCDCKGYSLFIASILQNLNIPYKYRFVSYDGSTTPTHVYVIVPTPIGKYITIDCVMNGYDKEKRFTYNKDLNMTKIVSLAGIGSDCPCDKPCTTRRGCGTQEKWIDFGKRDLRDMPLAEIEIIIVRDRLHTEKAIIEKNLGKGHHKAERHQDHIDVTNDALHVIRNSNDPAYELDLIAEHYANGHYNNATKVAGIGDLKTRKGFRKSASIERHGLRRKARLTRYSIGKKGKAKKAGKTSFIKKFASKTGRMLRGAAKGLKKVGKGILKVATAPQRLIIKGILELTLPKSAPYFLYTFISDPAIIAKLPAKVAQKRNKQIKLKNFIVNSIGMKEAHFNGIVRNGIMKRYHKKPEAVIADQMKGRLAGIGLIDDVISAVISIVKQISKLFGKKADVDKDAGSDASDWGGNTALASQIEAQPAAAASDGADWAGDTSLAKSIKQQRETTTFEGETANPDGSVSTSDGLTFKPATSADGSTPKKWC